MKKLLSKAALVTALIVPTSIEPTKAEAYYSNQYQEASIAQIQTQPEVILAQYEEPSTPDYSEAPPEAVPIAILLFITVVIFIYFIPTVIAFTRGSNLSAAVLVINLFLGWSILGWIAALVMAVLPKQKSQTIIVQQSTDGTNTTTTPGGVEKIQY